VSAESASEKKGLWSQIWVYVMIAVAAVMVLFYVVRPVGEELAVPLTQIFIIILVAVAGVAFLLVAHQFKWFETRTGQIMILIAVGLILWVIAELVFYYQSSMGMESFPGPADIFYVAGYVPFAIGLILYIRTVKMKFKPLMLAIWIGISVAVFLVILILEFIPFLADFSIYSVTIIYPAEDYMLFVLALVLVLKFRSGEIAKPWILLVIGIIMDALGDIWFTYIEWYELGISAYDLYDLFFTLSYVAMLAAGLYFLWLYKKH
jgi:hypothetical protein